MDGKHSKPAFGVVKKNILLIIIAMQFIITNQTLACTTFLISGKNSLNGKPMLFKNRDTDEMQNALAFFTDGKYKYIGLVNGTEEWKTMVWGGYNETGFAIINSAAYNNNIGDTSKIIDREGIVMKLALQTCETLEDFEKLLLELPKPMGLDANFGVIDAYGGTAYYETGNYNFTKFDANDPKIAPNGILVRTNHSTRADLTKGFGFCRYNTAIEALEVAASTKSLTTQFVFNNLSRNLKHSLTKTDLRANMPLNKETPDFRFFIDFIPRESTASAILIVGAKNKEEVETAMMWTILGFPLTSVAIPTWISAGNSLPKAVSQSQDLKSPICKVALTLKADCFPLTYDRGYNYINLSAVINQQNNGYLQLLEPIETEIFEKADILIKDYNAGKKTVKDLQLFYSWIDVYLESVIKTNFNINLFEK